MRTKEAIEVLVKMEEQLRIRAIQGVLGNNNSNKKGPIHNLGRPFISSANTNRSPRKTYFLILQQLQSRTVPAGAHSTTTVPGNKLFTLTPRMSTDDLFLFLFLSFSFCLFFFLVFAPFAFYLTLLFAILNNLLLTRYIGR